MYFWQGAVQNGAYEGSLDNFIAIAASAGLDALPEAGDALQDAGSARSASISRGGGVSTCWLGLPLSRAAVHLLDGLADHRDGVVAQLAVRTQM
jgi:hypothetical protein